MVLFCIFFAEVSAVGRLPYVGVYVRPQRPLREKRLAAQRRAPREGGSWSGSRPPGWQERACKPSEVRWTLDSRSAARRHPMPSPQR